MSTFATRFGRRLHLCGLVTLPAGHSLDPALVVVSIGPVPTPGPGRVFVSLANLASRHGMAALRFGVEPRAARASDDSAMLDILDALGHAGELGCGSSFVVLAAGDVARHVLLAAVSDGRVSGVMLPGEPGISDARLPDGRILRACSPSLPQVPDAALSSPVADEWAGQCIGWIRSNVASRGTAVEVGT